MPLLAPAALASLLWAPLLALTPLAGLPSLPLAARGGFGRIVGDMIRWLIMVAIYDICIGTIAEVFGVSRFVAAMIFLGILLAISAGGYVIRQKASRPADPYADPQGRDQFPSRDQFPR